MKGPIVTILPFIFQIINALQPRHDYYYDSTYYYPYSRTRTSSTYSKSSSSDDDTVAGLIVLIIIFSIIGAVVYYICRRCRNRPVPPPLPIYPIQQQYPYNPPYNQNYFPQYPPVNSGYPNNQVQSSPIYPPNYQYNASMRSNWVGPDYAASRKLKQNCGFCRTFSKYGQEPRIILSCQQRHTFHLFCINQHRAGSNRQGSNTYAANTCPVCNQVVEERVQLFCMLCKQKGVEVDLREFSDQHGVVDITKLLVKYGQYCQNCKRM